MRSGLRPIGVLLAVLLASGVCSARVVSQGTHEVMGALSWDRFSVSHEDGDGALSMLAFTPTYGYFILDNVELQFRVTLASLNVSGHVESYRADYSATSWSPIVLGLVHAPISDSYFPYVGFGLGGSYASDSEGTNFKSTAILPMVCAGGKFLLTERVAANIEFYYMNQNSALYIEELDGSQIGLTAGLSLLLGLDPPPEPEEPLWKKLWREQ